MQTVSFVQLKQTPAIAGVEPAAEAAAEPASTAWGSLDIKTFPYCMIAVTRLRNPLKRLLTP